MNHSKLATLFAIFALSAAATTASASGVNLLVNHSFETPSTDPGVEYFGAPGWTDFGGGTFTISDAVIGPAGAQDGSQALKVFGGCCSGVYQQFATNAGDIWTASVWALNDSNDQMANGQVAAINIEWIDAGGNNVGTEFGPTITAATAANVWTQLVISGAAPAGASFARIVLITGDFLPGGAGGAPRFDNASFSVVPIPGAVWLLGSALLGMVGMRRKSA